MKFFIKFVLISWLLIIVWFALGSIIFCNQNLLDSFNNVTGYKGEEPMKAYESFQAYFNDNWKFYARCIVSSVFFGVLGNIIFNEKNIGDTNER